MFKMSIKAKTLVILIVLCAIDVVIPIPILGAMLIYVVVQRPPWFEETVCDIYRT